MDYQELVGHALVIYDNGTKVACGILQTDPDTTSTPTSTPTHDDSGPSVASVVLAFCLLGGMFAGAALAMRYLDGKATGPNETSGHDSYDDAVTPQSLSVDQKERAFEALPLSELP